MNRRMIIVLSLVAVVTVGLSAGIYLMAGVDPETKRDQFVESAREYFAQGKIDEAIIMYKNALKTVPSSPDAHYGLGLGLMRKADYRGAFGAFRRAVDLNPEMVQPRYQLANFYLAGQARKNHEITAEWLGHS